MDNASKRYHLVLRQKIRDAYGTSTCNFQFAFICTQCNFAVKSVAFLLEQNSIAQVLFANYELKIGERNLYVI